MDDDRRRMSKERGGGVVATAKRARVEMGQVGLVGQSLVSASRAIRDIFVFIGYVVGWAFLRLRRMKRSKEVAVSGIATVGIVSRGRLPRVLDDGGCPGPRRARSV